MKRKIKKIVWDTERGIGVAQEYVPPSFPLQEEATEEQFRSSLSSVPPLFVKHSQQPIRDALQPSQYVLDLRRLRQTVTFPRPSLSRLSAVLSFIQQRFHEKRKKHAQSHVAPLLNRFPAIHAETIAELGKELQKPSVVFDFSKLHPNVLVKRFPSLSRMSIGIIFVFVLYALIPFVLLLRSTRWFPSVVLSSVRAPFYILRVFRSTIRYFFRRVALELPEVTPPLSFAPVALPTRSHRRRMLVMFVLLASILTIPLYAFSSSLGRNPATLEERTEALRQSGERAIAALSQMQWDTARRAWMTFRTGAKELGDDFYLTHPVIGPLAAFFSRRVSTGRSVIAAAVAIGDAGIAAATIGETLTEGKLPTERLVRAVPPLMDGIEAVVRIDETLQDIDPALLPPAFVPYYDLARSSLAYARTLLIDRGKPLLELLPSLLGHDRPMRYLVLFQNDAEARATGGFIGSIGILDLDRGVVRKLFMPTGGSYDLQGALRLNYRSPEPLQYVNPRFEFQDANWWPDFPTSAKKLLLFWEKAGGPTVDGVLAVNASFFEQLLSVTGPIDLPSYKKQIDAGNFFFETQKAVELEYDRVRNTPKKFLRDLADAVLLRMQSLKNEALFSSLRIFFDALATKDLQVYLTDKALQEKVIRVHIDGGVTPIASTDDTLRVVRTNIGGGKTDHVVRDAITHKTILGDDGSIMDRLTVTRLHHGKRGELFVGGRSRDYLRIYVPLGATLVSAEGFSLPTRAREIPPEEYGDDPDLASFANRVTHPTRRLDVFTEPHRTVFAGWIELEPGEVKTIELTYRLPFALPQKPLPLYRLHLEKQSGRTNTTVTHATLLPPSLTLTADSLPTLRSPLPWDHDITLVQTFR